MPRLPQFSKPMLAFAKKLSNDWALNLSALLAFNLLMASIPFLLVLLALLGITFGLLSPDLEHKLILNIGAVFPGQAGSTLVDTATVTLKRNAGFLLVLGVLSAIFLGSRLFIVIENCFGIIYRVRSRELLQQNLTALGMVLLFVFLVPLFLMLSLPPSALLTLAHPSSLKDAASTLTQVVIFLVTLLTSTVLFGLIYFIVPNRRIEWDCLWPGALAAAVLLMLYEKIFPWYTQTILHPSNQGTIVGFAIVILIFYNYLAFILLLGAELNSWIAGKRATVGDLQAIITQVDLHQTELADMVPAAVHEDEPHATHDKPQGDASSDRDGGSSGSASSLRGWKAVLPELRERRNGRSILAGQIAAASIITASLLTWFIRFRKR